SLARAQYASAHLLTSVLPEETAFYPTHGFGSFCSATQSESRTSTLGQELRANPVLGLGEQDYVDTLLAGLDAYPAYYAHMGPVRPALTYLSRTAPTRQNCSGGSRPGNG